MPAVFPVAYFGPVAYYQQMVLAGTVAFEVFEHYVKQTLRNRMLILEPNGVQNLSVPVIRPHGNKTLTKHILISNAENWRKNHWKAIESAYSSSSYFDHYGSEVKELIDFQSENLVDFNQNIHQRIVKWLDLPVQDTFTDKYAENVSSEIDFRRSFKEAESDHIYTQVFSPENKFVPGLSILDAIFNLGPMARKFVVKQ